MARFRVHGRWIAAGVLRHRRQMGTVGVPDQTLVPHRETIAVPHQFGRKQVRGRLHVHGAPGVQAEMSQDRTTSLELNGPNCTPRTYANAVIRYFLLTWLSHRSARLRSDSGV
jgi:hypothetical protein